MSNVLPLLVPGATPADENTQVYAPYDRTVIAEVEQADAAAVEQALATAYALHRDLDARLPVEERVAILERTAALMSARREELATQAAREGGKPLKDSLVETDRAIDGIKECIEHVRTQRGSEIPMRINAASAHRMAFTSLEPIGVVLGFSAFNHPLNLIVHQVAPAVAVGCPVIIKPAEATPLSCMTFVNLLREAGLPDGWCQALLTTDHDVSGKMVADSRVAFFSFIGSGKVGWKLRSQLAPGTRCALEHGGAAPVIVAADADLDDATPLLARGGLYHAGQVCVSVQRVFVHRSIAEDLGARLAAAAEAMCVGDPTHKDTDVGPLIRPGEVERVHEWVKEAVDGGAQLLCGGEALSETTYRPTILMEPAADARVSREEVFGPVVCLYPYDDIDQAIQRANDVPFSFQAAVFTRSLDTAWKTTRRLNAAAVMVNDHTAFRVDWMPFAGLRESGYGIGGIPYSMRDMQVEKLRVFRSLEL